MLKKILFIILIGILLSIIVNDRKLINDQRQLIQNYKDSGINIPATDNAVQEIINNLRDSLRDCQNQLK
jgi:hypothetical protein